MQKHINIKNEKIKYKSKITSNLIILLSQKVTIHMYERLKRKTGNDEATCLV